MTPPPELAIQRTLAAALRQALGRLVAAGAVDVVPAAVPIALERPRQPDHGDWSSNLALALAKRAGTPPRRLAELLAEHTELPAEVSTLEVAGPGFLNVRLAHRWFEDLVRRVVVAGERFGHSSAGGQTRVQVEFISANPTGPLTVGNARWAPGGDTIANLLAATGHEVSREYYFNDAGTQIELLGASVAAAYRTAAGVPTPAPQDGYRGEYVAELGERLLAERGTGLRDADPEAALAEITVWARTAMLAEIEQTLDRFGVRMDTWFSERRLRETGAIDRSLAELREREVVYDADGAVWLRTTAFGDDKDRPVIRSNGEPTYFAADVAYYRNKRERGFERLIMLLGADHHGYVPRLRAVARAFGDPDDVLEIILSQLVTIVRGGEQVRMSKRSGDLVTIDEVLDEVGRDAARYTLLRFSADVAIDFDLDAVKRQSLDNPVYYVQYAHARISSVLRHAREVGFTAGPVGTAELDRLRAPTEEALLRVLGEYEELVLLAAFHRAPHRLTRYAEDLAAAFHRFYAECRVLGEDHGLSTARYWLCVAARQVLGNVLGLAGVSAPDRM